MPNIADLTNDLHGCKIFSKLDLASAFPQIPMSPEHEQKTAISTPFGLFICRRMCFGLQNASQSFQRLIDVALQDLTFAKAYMDGILVGSKHNEEHFKHLEMVFRRLDNFSLRLKPKKYAFYQESVPFIGMLITTDGFIPLSDGIDAIENIKKPETVTLFLDMAGYNRRFIQGYSSIPSPLTDLLRGSRKSNDTFIWRVLAENTFRTLKESLQAVSLRFRHQTPNWNYAQKRQN